MVDYIDFKKAFLLYFDRIRTLTDEMRVEILEFNISSSRTLIIDSHFVCWIVGYTALRD